MTVFVKSLSSAGHYRAGRFFPPTETAFPAETFTALDMDKLQSDPRLEISFSEEEEETLPPKTHAPPKPSKAASGKNKANKDKGRK